MVRSSTRGSPAANTAVTSASSSSTLPAWRIVNAEIRCLIVFKRFPPAALRQTLLHCPSKRRSVQTVRVSHASCPLAAIAAIISRAPKAPAGDMNPLPRCVPSRILRHASAANMPVWM